MLQTQSYVRAAQWQPIVGRVVTKTDAAALGPCLRADADSLYVSAVVTFLDAIRGLQVGFYSWSTAKLYYSVFYAFRSILASKGHALIYEGAKPRHVVAVPGGQCKKLKGTTHEAVRNLFAGVLPQHWLLSQEIDLMSPPAWMLHLREDANYKRGHFWEPICPPHFLKLERQGLRRSIGAYLSDANLAFDVEHAAIAYPLNALRHARAGATRVSDEDAAFIEAGACDANGRLPVLAKSLL